VTDDSAFKKQVRARMAQTGENYTTARRAVIVGRDPGRPPVVLRVYLNPQVDLELTGEAARAYAAADEPGRRDMAGRLLAEHIELAGAGEAGVAAGSELMTVQALRVEEIGELVRRRIGRAAGVSAVKVGGDLDRVWVDIEAARPGVVSGHGGAEAGRLRAELEELTGKPVQLNVLVKPVPREGPGEAGSGRAG
jgi:KH domain